MALSLSSSSSSSSSIAASTYQPFSRPSKSPPSKKNNMLIINFCSLFNNSFLTTTRRSLRHRHNGVVTTVCCEVKETAKKLEIGSPIIVIEAPKMLKTAASVPCLRANSGLVNPGDVGRIVSRKPKDVWAVRLSIGTYLIDRRYFKPLELDE